MGDPDRDRMLIWIAKAARSIREEHGRRPANIAAERGVDQSTINRFESGRIKRPDLDAMIAAYARDTEIPVIEFWARALELWRAELSGEH